ncbi:MAG: hypothetical protein J07HQW1_01237 [Haloquadratum walsbyi J07HQW1]|uniref:Uncharacterized protein n=1 Tax=Haloquadratum walsbyi J07HQW1 TaxID=1238424 RepID=U1N3S9_9EURY|nr:MAG: hypothetical protein J07HQW1_01237 [Haloquadratum walsbyi J07HQW1]
MTLGFWAILLSIDADSLRANVRACRQYAGGQMCAPCSRLLEAGTSFLEFAAVITEVVGVTDERLYRGHYNVVIDVGVRAKHSRMLGFFRTCNVRFSFDDRVQIELVGF